MKIFEMINELESFSLYKGKCLNDGIKVGSAENEITGVGITIYPTTDVIRKAKESKINFLIAQEPLICSLENTSYIKDDSIAPHHISINKINMLKEYGITLYRYNDYAHTMKEDISFEGFRKCLGLNGRKIIEKSEPTNYKNSKMVLDNPITAKELAKLIETKTGLKHVRIAGCHNKKGRKLVFCFGIAKNIIQELRENDFVVLGELTEFIEAELAHDYAEQGFNKAILILGHYGTEVCGMKLFSEKLSRKHSDISIKYLECGDSYLYTES